MRPSVLNSTVNGMASTSGGLLVVSAAKVELEEAMSPEGCFESEGFVKFQSTVDDLLLAASTASTVFNFLVLYCAFKLFKKSGDTMHLFIINMTLGDLLLTIFCHPNEFLIRKHEFLKHIHLCAVIHFCNWLGLAVSGLSLTLLNMDKLIFFCWPFTYGKAMSKRLAAVLCFFIWAVSLGFVCYVWIFRIVYATADCMLQMTETKKYYYEIFMIVFCVMPVTSSLVVSTFLFRLIKQKRHAPAPLTDSSHVDMKREFKNKTKSLVFIFATTVWTSFSLLPYRIFNICRIHLLDWHRIDCHERELMNWLAWILIYLLTLNPIVNPLITAIVYAPYRKALRKLLISVPIGNRLQSYSTYRTTTETTTYHSGNKTRRTRGSGSTDQELYSFTISGRRLKGSEEGQRRSLNSSTDAPGSSGGVGSNPNHNNSSNSPKQSDSLKSTMTPSSTSTFSKGQQSLMGMGCNIHEDLRGRDHVGEVELTFIDETVVSDEDESQGRGHEETSNSSPSSGVEASKRRRKNITFQVVTGRAND